MQESPKRESEPGVERHRSFLEVALAVGLECDIISPSDVLRHIPAEVLAERLPSEQKTRLIAASIKAGRMDPNLVFETLEVGVFAEHMPMHMLWACIEEAAGRVLAEKPRGQVIPHPAVMSPGPAAAVSPVPSAPASEPEVPLARPPRRTVLGRRPARLAQNRGQPNIAEPEIGEMEPAGKWRGGASDSSSRLETVRHVELEEEDGDEGNNDWLDENFLGDELKPQKR